MLLGEMLIKNKVISETQLQVYLEKAINEKKMLGEVLISESVITKDQLMQYLKAQGYLRANQPDA
ncbi:MAG: hypothetical protein HZC16_03750 [Candidatus Omnitrophica bacterium]|nr:hypothetical protein [Candidatus Omnitrophota bacterium]